MFPSIIPSSLANEFIGELYEDEFSQGQYPKSDQKQLN